jgi:hypothetical protein
VKAEGEGEEGTAALDIGRRQINSSQYRMKKKKKKKKKSQSPTNNPHRITL